MKHGILKTPHPVRHVFHASTFFATAAGITIFAAILTQGLLHAGGLAHVAADHHVAIWLASLFTGLLGASAIFDRYETEE